MAILPKKKLKLARAKCEQYERSTEIRRMDDEKKAKSQVEEMCKKLLANLVIEDYKIL